jgi:predicted DNA-binding transcriptional regulator YafY
MDRFDRIYAFHKILGNARYPISRKELQDRLECSKATFTRLVEDMRDYLGAPIEYDRATNGYHYQPGEDGPYQLPGLWFSPKEIEALLACRELLAEVQPGLLEEHIRPLYKRIDQILKTKEMSGGGLGSRVRILRSAARKPADDVFQAVAEGVGSQTRLTLHYHGREKNLVTVREVSPQRLVYYRDNWYLDGWCHLRKGLRSFSLDRALEAKTTGKKGKKLTDKALDDFFAGSYGIFGGKPDKTARLRFSREITPWVERETFHPHQVASTEGGRLILDIPYGDHRELVMDILRYGEDVEVLSPVSLRSTVRSIMEKALQQYR